MYSSKQKGDSIKKVQLRDTQIKKWEKYQYQNQQLPNYGINENEFSNEEELKKKMEDNELEKFQFEKPDDYINALRFNIDLNKLYKVIDSCCYNQESEFCSVLVEVKFQLDQIQKFNHNYLLQVWSNEGKMIFERKLNNPPAAWNIIGQNFVFQEQSEGISAPIIYLLEMSKTKQCNIVNFELSNQIENNQEKNLNQYGQDDQEQQPSEKSQVIPRTIGISKKYLIFNYNNRIYYTLNKNETPRTFKRNLETQYFQLENECKLISILDFGEETVLCISNELNQLKFYQVDGFPEKEGQISLQLLNLGMKENDDPRLKGIKEDEKHKNKQKKGAIQPNQSKKLEDIKDIRFVVMLDSKKVYQYSKKDIKDSYDGLSTARSNKTIKLDQDIKPKFTCSALVLRNDQSFEFYSDWNLVSYSNYTEITKQKKIPYDKTIIETDNNNFYIQTKITDNQIETTELFEISLSWGNLIGMSVADKILTNQNQIRKKDSKDLKKTNSEENTKKILKKKLIIEKFAQKLESSRHKRISGYFRLFTQFLNFHTYMIVAHREFISIFDLRDKNGNIKKTIQHEDEVKTIQTINSIDTVEKEILGVLVLLGNNQIHQVNFHDEHEKPPTKYQIKNKIICYSSDRNDHSAFYYITQQNEKLRKEYKTFYENEHSDRFRIQEEQVMSQKLFQLFACRDFKEVHLHDFEDNKLDFDAKISVYQRKNDELEEQKFVTNLFISNKVNSYSLSVNFQNQEQTEQISNTPKVDFLSITYHHEFIEKSNDDVEKEETDKKDINWIKDIDEHFENDMLQNQGTLVGVVHFKSEKDTEKRNDYLARITTKTIQVFDSKGKLVECYTNTCIQDIVLIDQNYVYCLCESSNQPIKKYDFRKQQAYIPKGASISKQINGLYVYDMNSFLQDAVVENYYLAPAVVGLACQLDFSDQNGRISYFTNFNQLSMLPFPHRNTINFLGMDDSNDYLIWREKDGFLSALNKDGALRVWSIGSGKFIGSYRIEKIKGNNLDSSLTVDKLKDNYEIYKASTGTKVHGDTCYTKGYQNYQDYSLQLFIENNKSKNEVDKQIVMEERSKIFQNQRGQNVNILRKEQREYNFVVLKLQTLYDKENLFQVGVLRKFTHRLHDKNEGKFPSLYLNKDALKMMEVIDRQIAIIYEPVSDIKNYYDQNPVQWVVKHFINQYPTILQGIQPLPFLFNPDFEKYIDVDYSKGLFVIKYTDPKKQHKNKEIPKSLLDLSVVREFEHQDKDEDKNIDPKKIKLQNEESIAEIAKRIHFFRKDKLRIINLEGIDTIFDIKTGQIVAYSKRDNQNVFKNFEKINNLKHRHLILDNFVFDQKDILERLVNRCQNYKSDIEFAKFDLAMQNIFQEKESNYQKPKILNFLFKVDYQCNNFLAEVSFTLLDWITTERILQDPVFDLDNIDRLQQIQLCFNIFPNNQTILHKLALDAVQQGQDEETTESIDAITQKLFCACKKGLKQSEYFKSKQSFEIPLLEDMNGDTVLDIALNDEPSKNVFYRIKQIVNIVYPMSEDSIFKDDTEQKIFQIEKGPILRYIEKKIPDVILRYFRGVVSRLKKYGEESQELIKNLPVKKSDKLNSQMAMTVLAYMQNYSYLHSSSSIYRSVIRSINIALPNIGEYLDSRCVASEHMPNRTQHELMHIPYDWQFVYRQEYWCTEDKYTNETNTDSKKWVNQVYNTVQAKIWDKKQYLQTKLFKSKGVQKNMIIRYFDVPQMQLNSKVGYRFLQALKEADRQNEDIALDFYSKRIVQILINEHWERTYGWLLGLLFTPYVAMLIVFEIWSNFTLQSVGGWSDEAGASLQTILIIFSSYFLTFDFVQLLMMRSIKQLDIWFFIKIIPMCLVLYCATYYNVTQVTIVSEDPVIKANQLQFWQIQAFAGFFMWFRMLYYLRSLEHFSYFIRMLIEVIRKITIFLIILAIVVLGFADTFYSLSTGQQFAPTDQTTGEPKYKTYINSYTNSLQYSYEIVLGQFDPDLNNRDPLTWVFFVLASVISMLILSNMLIEIVSQTYGDISDVKYLYVFKERVELICDWESTLQVLKYFRDFCILPFNIIKWLLKVTKFCRKNVWKSAEQRLFKNYVKHKCNLIVVAWEDPEDKDTTPDFIEDENIETTDEKIDVLQKSLSDIKQQLGLEAEIQESYGDVNNPIKSISEIDEKLEKVINVLGLSNYKNQKPQTIIPIPRVQHEEKMTQKVVHYKKDEVFKWQQKMQVLI